VYHLQLLPKKIRIGGLLRSTKQEFKKNAWQHPHLRKFSVFMIHNYVLLEDLKKMPVLFCWKQELIVLVFFSFFSFSLCSHSTTSHHPTVLARFGSPHTTYFPLFCFPFADFLDYM